jgi:hypothetical protein
VNHIDTLARLYPSSPPKSRLGKKLLEWYYRIIAYTTLAMLGIWAVMLLAGILGAVYISLFA